MINAITVTLPNADRLRIGMGNDDPSGYTVVSVTGLGSPTATINTVGGPGFDGDRFNSSKANKRSITMTLAVNGLGLVEEGSRINLYKWFSAKQQLVLGVETDTRTAVIDAYVETNEVNMFSKIENAVITFVCPLPYFRELETNNIVFFGTDPIFSFPFSNESLVAPLLEMGIIQGLVEQTIQYNGDASTGVIFNLDVFGPSTDLGVINNTSNEAIFIDTDIVNTIAGGPLDTGDRIVIDTRVGNKSVILIRNSIIYNILNAIDIFTKWVTLVPGPNDIVYSAATGIGNISVSLVYDVLYEGV